MHVQAQIDAETGELIRAKKAWWAFLASEDDEEEVEEITEEESETPVEETIV